MNKLFKQTVLREMLFKTHISIRVFRVTGDLSPLDSLFSQKIAIIKNGGYRIASLNSRIAKALIETTLFSVLQYYTGWLLTVEKLIIVNNP